MGLSIFELKTSDSFPGGAVKTGSTAGKPEGEGFSKIFEGCVNECAGDARQAGVSAETVDAPGGEDAVVLADAAGETGTTVAQVFEAAAGTVKVSAESESTVTNPVQAEKPAHLDIKAEGTASLIDVSVETALEVTSVGADTAHEAPKAIGTEAGLKTSANTVDTAKVINPEPATVAGSASVVTGESLGVEDAWAVDKRTGAKSTGQEKTVRSGNKTEARVEEKDIDEKGKTADSAQGRSGSVTAGLCPDAAKPETAHSTKKAAVNAATDKADNRGDNAAAVLESATESRPGVTEVKSEVDGRVAGKAGAALVTGALDTPASVKAAVMDAVNAAPEVIKSEASKDSQGVSRKAVSTDGDSTGKDGVKTPAVDKNAGGNGFVSVKTETTDNATLAGMETKEPIPAAYTQPLQGSVDVKAHMTQPSDDRVAAVRADNPDVNGASVNKGEQNRTAPAASYVNEVRQDLSRGKDEKSGDNEAGRKTGPGSELSHGVQHIGGDKPRFDAPTVKPVEPARPEAVFEKLSTGVRMSLAGSNREVSISLTPEHLGSMHIKMSVDDSSVKARIIVESEAAKTVLDSDSGKLREVFASHGLTLDRYTVELSTNAFSGGPSQFAGSPSGESHYGGRGYHGTNPQGPDTAADTTPYRQTENTRRASGGVDIFV